MSAKRKNLQNKKYFNIFKRKWIINNFNFFIKDGSLKYFPFQKSKPDGPTRYQNSYEMHLLQVNIKNALVLKKNIF